ncbi:MAG TPA: peptidylprolyl isomerase, partial [Gemmata sp.]|nr:peptidylprolyl isomerase [Gemmata sp.]
MRKIIRGVAAVSLALALALSATAQTPPAGGNPVVPQVTPPEPKPEVVPTGNAAVVNGQVIPEKAVYRALRQFPDSARDMARKEIMAHLIENAMIDQYLNAIKINVTDAEINDLINGLKKELLEAKKDYAKELQAMLLSEDEFRTEVIAQMKWEKFVKQQGTDAELKKLFDSSPDVFDGTQVRARHILLTPGTDEAKQKEAAGTLRGIKKVVEDEAAKAVAALPATADALAKEQSRNAKIEELFSAYAKQYSMCPSKKDGGDLNFFPRAGAMVEPFAKAAFAVKAFEMTDVVVTEFGYHLILVTQRRQGTPKKFEEVKEDVRSLYAMRLREAVIAAMKPKAK